jgi:lipopolysaccharide transport system permease protein
MRSPAIVIEAGKEEQGYWLDVWRYRELLYFLAWRDIAVRYKQTVIGVAWALIRPALTMLIFVAIFSGVAKLPSEGAAPYAIMVCAGMLPWQLFTNTLSESSNSLVANANLVSKIYFPRILVPLSSMGVSLVDFAVSMLLLVVVMMFYMYPPGWTFLMIPFFTLHALLASAGIGILMSSLTVRYRDFRFVMPFVVQFGLYVSPVGYTSSVIKDPWLRTLFSLNPMVGVIDGFRWAVLNDPNVIFWPGMLLSFIVTAGMLYWGIRTFRRTERSMVDVI